MTQHVYGFHYTLKDKDQNIIDTSADTTPLVFLENSGQIIPGLEQVVVTMNIGDKKNVEIKAADAYGEVIPDLQITVQKSQFPADKEIKLGDQFQVNEEEDAPIFTVVEIEEENIHIDGNHPMAGHDLFFDVELTEKREATQEEMDHGHAHGPGGHHH
jgi:FKBP-type peptidyl-prolyl cis-trans isomerase SlyD